jgi:GT2 family glycosyltransferase
MKVSVIIPAYYINDSYVEMTQDCVNSIKAHCDVDEIIVVDDHSPYRAGIEFAKNIRLKENGGYAKAVNAGVELAGGDILIILNNDTLVLENSLQTLISTIEQGYDIASIRTTDSDGYETKDKITDGDKFGSCWAIRSTVWYDLGGLSEEFGRGYAEDLDLWKRALKKGFSIGKNHNAVIFHEGKKTFKIVDPDDTYYMDALMKYQDKYGVIE